MQGKNDIKSLNKLFPRQMTAHVGSRIKLTENSGDNLSNLMQVEKLQRKSIKIDKKRQSQSDRETAHKNHQSHISMSKKLITNCEESIKEWKPENSDNRHNSNTAMNMLDESNS